MDVEQFLFPTGAASGKAFRPRPYQVAAVAQIRTLLETTSASKCLAVLATGTGKTEICAMLIEAMGQGGSMVISPLIDLVGQTAGRLRSRGVACGVEQGALRSAENVTVASYQSLLSRSRWEKYVGRVKVVLIDEVHLNYTRSALRMLEAFADAGAKIIGLTASPDRATGDPLVKFYEQVGFYYPYQQALADGWLVPAKVWLTVLEDLDLSPFKKKFGDFDAEELGRILAREKTVQAVASMVEQHHEGKPSVVFCQSIHQSELLLENLQRRGLKAAIVHSKMGDERQMHLSDFESGRTNIILNVGVLTLGWDHPPVAKLFIAKPTKSKSKYIQMFGRGTRPLPGVVDDLGSPEQRRKAIAESAKPHFEIFDITDSSRHNDLQTAVTALRPDENPELLKRVRKRLEGREGVVDLDPLIAEERAAEAAEQAARDALEVHRRAGIIARAKFGVYERDMFATAETPEKAHRRRHWVMLFGKHKGQPLTTVPLGYLQWCLREANVRGDFRAAIEREVSRR